MYSIYNKMRVFLNSFEIAPIPRTLMSIFQVHNSFQHKSWQRFITSNFCQIMGVGKVTQTRQKFDLLLKEIISAKEI